MTECRLAVISEHSGHDDECTESKPPHGSHDRFGDRMTPMTSAFDTVRLSCGHEYTKTFLIAALDDPDLGGYDTPVTMVVNPPTEADLHDTIVGFQKVASNGRGPHVTRQAVPRGDARDDRTPNALTSIVVGIAIAIPPFLAVAIMSAITVAIVSI
jgi:hypothetical protein